MSADQVRSPKPVYPTDALSVDQKCRIYFARVVDLAVAQGLIVADPETEVGHFAYSHHYYEGKRLEERLLYALKIFEEKHPEMVAQRRQQRNEESRGVADLLIQADATEKVGALIRIGASYGVWPKGTSFVLTYPWDLGGNGRVVTFRDDLTEFTRRRVLQILEKAGKLRTPTLFHAF